MYRLGMLQSRIIINDLEDAGRGQTVQSRTAMPWMTNLLMRCVLCRNWSSLCNKARLDKVKGQESRLMLHNAWDDVKLVRASKTRHESRHNAFPYEDDRGVRCPS